MDAAIAQSLASGVDPTAITALKAHPNDPTVRRAVADQFGAMLMEGMMRNADGSPLSVVDGVGGDTVSALYANVMSQVAASSNRLGFADLLLKSMPAANGAATTTGPATVTATPPATTASAAPATAPSPMLHGFLLQQYWQGRHVSVTPGAPLAAAPTPYGARPFAMVPQAHAMPESGAATHAAAPLATPAAPSSSSPYTADPASGLSGALVQPSGPMFANTEQQHFAATLAPLLQGAAQQLGVSSDVLLAQAALESGWGRSMPGNNLFGIKAGAGWTGATVQAYTHETSSNGETGQTASFRAYPSLAAAVADYVRLIAHDARYHAALGAGDDPLAYGQALVASGYATDPAYASKLAAVAASSTVTAALGAPSGVAVARPPAAGGAA